MPTRILLDDDAPAPAAATPRPKGRHRRRRNRPAGHRPSVAVLDWHQPSPDSLLLLVTDEPAIGLRFRYAGVGWEVVEYRAGWIARMLVH